MGYIFPRKSVDDVGYIQAYPIDVFTHYDPQLTIEDFRDAIRKIQKQEPDPSHRTFGKLVP
jgi:hypothetical protein